MRLRGPFRGKGNKGHRRHRICHSLVEIFGGLLNQGHMGLPKHASMKRWIHRPLNCVKYIQTSKWKSCGGSTLKDLRSLRSQQMVLWLTTSYNHLHPFTNQPTISHHSEPTIQIQCPGKKLSGFSYVFLSSHGLVHRLPILRFGNLEIPFGQSFQRILCLNHIENGKHLDFHGHPWPPLISFK